MNPATESIALVAVVVVSGVLFKFMAGFNKTILDLTSKFEQSVSQVVTAHKAELCEVIANFKEQVKLQTERQLTYDNFVREAITRYERVLIENTNSNNRLIQLLETRDCVSCSNFKEKGK
jgi:ribosomal protein S4